MANDDDIGLSARLADHNLALLDALSELSKAKVEITVNLGKLVKALVLKAGGEVVLDSAFVEAADDPCCALETKIGKDKSVTIWVEKHTEIDQ